MRTLSLSVLLVLAAVTGCRRNVQVGSPPAGAPPAANAVGGATARDAVERFMAAAKRQDLDAMSLVWGTSAGPVRSTMSRQEWEMREVSFMRCLRHDSYRALGESPAAGGERVIVVELKFQDLTRSTNFTVTPGAGQRWFVKVFEMDPLSAICQKRL